MHFNIKLALVLLLAFSGPMTDEGLPLREAKAVEEKTEVKTEVKTEKKQPAKAYSIHGTIPNRDWQRYLRNELTRKGIEWYFPYAVCQIYQESRWNPKADNGRDKGLTQQKGVYWLSRAARYGIPNADIWDPYAQIHVFSCMMAEYLRLAKNDVGWALSYYFYGNGQRADKYVHDVLSHMDYLKEVK